MKKTLFAAACALALCACSAPKDPVEQIISDYMETAVEGEGKLSVDIYGYEKIDSTTFREELQRRKNVFELKLDQNQKFYSEYNSKGQRKAAAEKMAAMIEDAAVVKRLDSLGVALGERIDDVAFYDYSFSGEVSGRGVQDRFKEKFIAITPQGEVLAMVSDRKSLHKSTGRVIPGYVEAVKSE